MGELRPGWRRVKFGDVVVNSTKATKDHEADGFTRYIIGQHIPAEGGRITTWNPVGDAEFGSRIRTIIREGDVLCTTRGPNLKVAVATFDCLSAHTNFVLRPRDPNELLPGVLEAVVRSDGFQDHLRKHFRGSTNLFVNWSDAAQYEFALPPLEEQRRLAEALVAAQRSEDCLREAVTAATTAYRAIASNLIGKLWSGTPMPTLGELNDPEAPICYGIVKMGEMPEKGVPVLRTENLNGDYSVDLYFASEQVDFQYRRSRVRSGDVLIAIQGVSTGKIGVVPDGFNGNINRHLARFRAGARLDRRFFVHVWASDGFKSRLRAATGGTTKPELTIGGLKALQVPCPPTTEQSQIADTLDAASAVIDACRERQRHAQLLRTCVVATALTGAI